MTMGYGYGDYGGWAPYVPVAERRRRAKKKMEALRKKGVDVQPVEIEGRKIATSFWGEAWCDHLESFSDYENRLPRGRTYVRNGSVCHLAISKGQIEAKVSGSELYTVKIKIKTLAPNKWNSLKQRCGGRIGSLLELLEGRLSDHVMEVVTDRQEGLFPLPKEISLGCSCPDWAVMCKHVAAVLYGVGARLDSKPELLFTLRGVNHEDLIQSDAEQAVAAATSRGKSKRLATSEIGEVFGIEIDAGSAETPVENDNAKKTTGRRRSTTARAEPKAAKPPSKASPKAKTPTTETTKAVTTKAKKKGTRSPSKTPAKKEIAAKKDAAKKAKTRAA
jgi:uncharacterized Zn finger protein